jgi:hypothetical protein
MKNTVHNDATSSNLKGTPMTKTIGLHWLQQVTKHVPATDEASVHRAQLRVKPLYCHSGGSDGGSVTARIGLYVESDLSMYFQEILQTNLLSLFGFAGNTKIYPILREIRF